jgi:hypothetical protein
MRVEVAYWADHTESRPDGRFDIEGFGPFLIQTPHLPTMFPDYNLPVLLRFTPQDKGRNCSLKCTIYSPDNAVIANHDQRIYSPYPEVRKFIPLRVERFALATQGTYRIALEADGARFDLYFDVELHPELEAEQGASIDS